MHISRSRVVEGSTNQEQFARQSNPVTAFYALAYSADGEQNIWFVGRGSGLVCELSGSWAILHANGIREIVEKAKNMKLERLAIYWLLIGSQMGFHCSLSTYIHFKCIFLRLNIICRSRNGLRYIFWHLFFTIPFPATQKILSTH